MTIDISTPDWVKNAVFYQIFPDRFAYSTALCKPNNLEAWESPPTSNGIKGGDLIGIVEHLDYLQDLGVSAIYLNPIFQSACNHRYHTHDYYQVDPILGGNQALQVLLEQAHRLNIRIILDGVFNHASRGFYQFNHILETGPASPFIDWFTIYGFPLNAYQGTPNYKCWVGLPALPEFNTKNLQVRKFIFDIAHYWLDQGIDGWRLDVPYCIDDDSFWQEFRQVVKSTNPEAYIVGEIAWEAQRWLQGDQFDAVMNYQFTQACLGYFAGPRIDRAIEKNMMGLSSTKLLTTAGFAQRVEDLLKMYPDEIALAQLNILDSHDMPRFTSLAGGDPSAYQLSILFQMTYPGAPCIYYGDEIGMVGGRSGPPEEARASFNWNPGVWDHQLRNMMKNLIAIRKDHPALRAGSFTVLHAQDALLVYERRLKDEQLIIAINNSDRSLALDHPLAGDWPNDSTWQDLLHDNQAVIKNQHLCGAILPGRSGAIFKSSRSAARQYPGSY